jgi:single-stranded DNA-binding protein
MEKLASERIAIRGVVSRDPELNRTPKGKVFARVNLAVDEVQIDGKKENAGNYKWQTAVFWGVDAADKVAQLKAGTQVFVEGERVVRQYEGRDGQMRVSDEIHQAAVTVEKAPREKVAGVAIDMKGEVLYAPELKASTGSKFYTTITIQPETGRDKVRAVFFGEEAMSLARTVHRGDKVALKGELVEKEYTNREGTPTKSLEVQKASMEVLDKGRSTGPSRDAEQGLG